MYSIGHSLVVSIGYEDLGSSFKHVITLLFGLSMYRVSVYIAQQTKEDPALIGWIAKSLMIAFMPPLAAGFLQLVDAFFVRSGFSGAFTGLFSEKVYHGQDSNAVGRAFLGCDSYAERRATDVLPVQTGLP